MLTAALSTVLALVPPILPLPAELEVCVLQAEVCVLERQHEGGCADPLDPGYLDLCVSRYEDCSYAFKLAHEPNCRVARAWCLLESSTASPPEVLADCLEVRWACPDPVVAP